MPGPVLDIPALLVEVGRMRAEGRRMVLTNGVFDLLHVGHLRYLRSARRLGDVLVVGVNEDAAVRALKPGRPLVPQDDRAELVAALAPVDYVVLFGDRTAERLLEALRPDVYAKGGDYTATTLPERDVASRVGATLEFIPIVPGRSTSGLLRRLRDDR